MKMLHGFDCVSNSIIELARTIEFAASRMRALKFSELQEFIVASANSDAKDFFSRVSAILVANRKHRRGNNRHCKLISSLVPPSN